MSTHPRVLGPVTTSAPGAEAALARRSRSLSAAGLVALLVLTGLGLALRLTGLDHLLPHRTEMDAHITTQVRALVEEGGWERDDPRRVNAYPTLIARLALLAPFRAGPPAAHPADPGAAALAAHREAAAVYHLRVRAIVALAAAALIPLTFCLVRLYAGFGAALLAAAFMAFEPLQLLFATQARAHAFVSSALLLSVLAAVRLRRRPSAANYLLAGLAGGVALGSLHSGLAALPPLLCAHLAREREQKRGGALGLLCLAAPLVLAGAWFYGDILASLLHQGLFDPSGNSLRQGGHRFTLAMFNGAGFFAVAQTFFTTNPVLATLAGAGALLCTARLLRAPRRLVLRSDAAVVLAFALPYALAIGVYRLPYERITLPLHPYLALLAALFLAWSAGLAARRYAGATPRAMPWLVSAGILAFPALCTFKLSWLRVRPDTSELAARHIERHLGEGETLLLAPGTELPRFYVPELLLRADGRPLPIRRLWIEYQLSLPQPPQGGRLFAFRPLVYGRSEAWFRDRDTMDRELMESPAGWMLLPVLGSARPEEQLLHAAVAAWGTPVASFRSGRGWLDPPPNVSYGYGPSFLPQLLDAQALGPTLVLYQRRGREQ
jgi:hypothetical protein